MSWKEACELAAGAIREADALLIGTGAGMGVDSGLPDFRGDAGFWKAYPAFKDAGLSFVDLANPSWFFRDPTRAWGFYGHRYLLYRDTEPHQGFQILRRWGEAMHDGYFVFTSNVDGHFQRAGFDRTQVVECHGTLQMWQCIHPCCNELGPMADFELTVDEEFRAEKPLPHCGYCGDLARPNVLMFGDGHWVDDRTSAQIVRYQAWLSGVQNKKMVVVEWALVPPCRQCGGNASKRTVN